MSVDTEVRPGRHAAVPPNSPSRLLRSTGDWARRAPLMPALVFMIIVTQLPFVVTIIASFMNWNAYYPDERGFAGIDNFRRVLTDVNTRHAIWVTILLTAGVVLISLVLGLCISNGIFSPYLNLAIPVAAVLLPEIFPRTINWVLFWSSVLLSTTTLLVSGVPAALYERLVERDPNAAASTWIWLAGAATLCLPAVLRML